MTIYCTHKDRLTPPAWDKSGEKRVMMDKSEMAKFMGHNPTTHAVAKARDGRWAWGTEGEDEVRSRKRGDFDTAAEAAADAEAKGAYIILNTAPPARAEPRRFIQVTPKAAAAAEINEKIAEHNEAARAGHFRIKKEKVNTRKEAAVARAPAKGALPPGGAKTPAPRGKGIGAFCEGLILAGKTDAETLAACRREFPDASTKEASVKWYRNKLVKEGRIAK